MTADEIKNLVNSTDYYDRYDKAKHWDSVNVLAGRPMQSAEFNEIQHIAEEKIKSLFTHKLYFAPDIMTEKNWTELCLILQILKIPFFRQQSFLSELLNLGIIF